MSDYDLIKVLRRDIEGFSELTSQILREYNAVARKVMIERLLGRLESWCADQLTKR